MKIHCWDADKNNLLKSERNISFEDIMYYVEHGKLLAIIEHPNQHRYPGQKMYIVNANDYAYLVPYAETENEIYLITIIPSRKATRKYLEK